METLTKQFESRVAGFLERTGLKPSMFGLRATGDPNLMRQLRRGRSPTLATADRVLAFMDDYESAHADCASSRSRRPGGSSLRGRRDTAVTRATEQEIEAAVLILGLPGVRVRTGLSRSTIYLRVTEGRFPKPVCAVGWVEAEVDAWIRERITVGRGDAQ